MVNSVLCHFLTNPVSLKVKQINFHLPFVNKLSADLTAFIFKNIEI